MALKDVTGQDKAIGILVRTIRRGRAPSSYLFAGESGIGKKFTAVNLAKALNCPKAAEGESHSPPGKSPGPSEGFDACDACSSCRRIDAGIHPDVLLISPESGLIKIDAIRTADSFLSLKSFEGMKKVIIIDDADLMNQFSANAFLKTLEEPPGDSLIILVSSQPERLPDTIRSRCSRLHFTPLSQEDCEHVIRSMLSPASDTGNDTPSGKKKKPSSGKSRKPDIPAEHISTLVRLCMGRPGAASTGDLIEERNRCLRHLEDMIHAEKDGWASREEMEQWIDHFMILLRDMAVMKTDHAEQQIIHIDIKDYISSFSRTIDMERIIETYLQLHVLKRYLPFHLNKSLTWNYTGSLLRSTLGV
jgi:DNA polymerase-3 subunit delta'